MDVLSSVLRRIRPARASRDAPDPHSLFRGHRRTDFSSSCKIVRADVEDSGLALFFTLGVLSFDDARPGGNSYIDDFEGNE